MIYKNEARSSELQLYSVLLTCNDWQCAVKCAVKLFTFMVGHGLSDDNYQQLTILINIMLQK